MGQVKYKLEFKEGLHTAKPQSPGSFTMGAWGLVLQGRRTEEGRQDLSELPQ